MEIELIVRSNFYLRSTFRDSSRKTKVTPFMNGWPNPQLSLFIMFYNLMWNLTLQKKWNAIYRGKVCNRFKYDRGAVFHKVSNRLTQYFRNVTSMFNLLLQILPIVFCILVCHILDLLNMEFYAWMHVVTRF